MTNYLFCIYRASYQINQKNTFPFFFFKRKGAETQSFYSTLKFRFFCEFRVQKN